MRYRRGRHSKTKMSSRRSVVLLLCLLCATTAIGLPKQTPLTILASSGADGNFYGTTADRRSPPAGTVCYYAVATHQNYSLAVRNGTFSGVTTVPAAPRTTPHNNGSSRISHRSGCRC